jgi:adenylyl-sulfate kinase
MRSSDSFTLWLTGLSGAGKTSIAEALKPYFSEQGKPVEVLDGEICRSIFAKQLGFSRADRDHHIRHLGFIGNLLSRNGVIAIVAAISPYQDTRDEVRKCHGERFIEVFVSCPIEVLIRRDPRGLYARALAGEISNFTGISDPYERPWNPEITVHTDHETLQESTHKILDWLINRRYISPLVSAAKEQEI